MNKTKLFLLCSIVILAALLGAKRIFRPAEMMQLNQFEEEIDTVILEKASGDVTVMKKGDEWFIDGGELKATTSEIENIISKIKDIRLYDIVSDRQVYSRYDLDDEKVIRVKLQASGEIKRDVFVGKQSPGVNQAFVRIPDDNRIYLAGSFGPHDFAKSVTDLRDKVVAEFSESSIKSVAVTIDEETYTLLNEEITETDDEGNETKKSEWKLEENPDTKLDQQKVKTLVGTLRMVRSKGFSDSSTFNSLEENFVTVSINAFDSITTLTVKSLDENTLAVKSSQRPDYFTIDKTQLESLKKSQDELLPDTSE
jgi:hypothetical protein